MGVGCIYSSWRVVFYSPTGLLDLDKNMGLGCMRMLDRDCVESLPAGTVLASRFSFSGITVLDRICGVTMYGTGVPTGILNLNNIRFSHRTRCFIAPLLTLNQTPRTYHVAADLGDIETNLLLPKPDLPCRSRPSFAHTTS
jgi:hypothetical protein